MYVLSAHFVRLEEASINLKILLNHVQILSFSILFTQNINHDYINFLSSGLTPLETSYFDLDCLMVA
jgi:hypothetical protein